MLKTSYEWYVDSSVAAHMTNQKLLFIQFIEEARAPDVSSECCTSLKIMWVRVIHTFTVVDSARKEIDLKNVILVQHLFLSLISVRAQRTNNLIVVFKHL